MDRQIMLPDPPQDAAAQAFNELRQEVSLMLRALAKFTDEHPKVEIPDYTDTLNHIAESNRSLALSYRTMRETPVLQTTADEIAKQIAAVGADARRSEQAALATATAGNSVLARELSGYLDRAKTADSQFKWLCGIFVLGFVIGGLIIGATLKIVWRDNERTMTVATEQAEPLKTRKR